jgi:hypothetical protein
MAGSGWVERATGQKPTVGQIGSIEKNEWARQVLFKDIGAIFRREANRGRTQNDSVSLALCDPHKA